jgi:hypothetical protein
LNHEVRYYAVKYQVIEVVALGKGSEILCGLGSMFVVQLDSDESLETVSKACCECEKVSYKGSFERNIGSHG